MSIAIVLAVLTGLLVGALLARRAWRGRVERWADEHLTRWRDEETDAVGQDALRRSHAVLTGRVAEQLAPIRPEFGFDPADARFIGSPIDFVVFDGYNEVRSGHRTTLRSIVLLDVKTGRSALSTIQRRVRDCVQRGDVAWTVVPAWEDEVG